MNKSLEALENLVHCKSETKCKECKYKYRCTMERDYNTIKQDLERLEQLEKRNKELVNIIDELREENFKIKQIQTCIWGEQDTVRQEQIETLIKENNELLVNKNFAQGVALRYKKAIEILKCFLNYVESDFDTYVTSQCTDEEQNLLKEVL